MTRPRNSIVSLDATPYYHVTNRCVRRSFLCGFDKLTGKDFSYRRDWFKSRLEQLQSLFAIDIAAYAIMSNHYHLVVYIDENQANSWTDDEVLTRWTSLFYGPYHVQKYLRQESITPAEQNAVAATALEWRERLKNLSWFMRCLNENIARQINLEDQCTGRFWEGRFKSIALLDEKAILSCMAYVDLNPIRAQQASSPETSTYTSIEERILCLKNSKNNNEISDQPSTLLPFIGNQKQNSVKGIEWHLTDYLELVDWTGCQIKSHKRGCIDQHLPNILARFNMNSDQWMTICCKFESNFKVFAGAYESLRKIKRLFNTARVEGGGFSKLVFG